jgi:ubiquinone/menaquinone biosynthesis C-methylase UbiE
MRLENFIKSFAVIAIKPDDLEKMNQLLYAKSEVIEKYCKNIYIEKGLDIDEKIVLAKINKKKGKILLIGVGGGREAISFSKMRFEVIGVDFVPEMVEKTILNCKKRGILISGIVSSLSNLMIPKPTYDIIWMSDAVYSNIPTKKRRIRTLLRLKDGLNNNGKLVCHFVLINNHRKKSIGEWLKKFISFIIGNIEYEKGDIISPGKEFVHIFSSMSVLKSEFKSGGFEICDIHINNNRELGVAILRSTQNSCI